MKTPNHSISHGFLSLLIGIVVMVAPALLFTSCFTGIEGTKKISLTKGERKALLPSEEEEFFRPVTGVPLSEWEAGREFIAPDNRAILIFDQEGLEADPDAAALEGKILRFAGTDSKLAPDGSMNTVLLFTLGDRTYRYNTGKTRQEALTNVKSDQIPMLIDLRMVEAARSLLVGKKLWTRSPLWYDERGERFTGRKYVPVTVRNVTPGTVAFPMKVEFTDKDGRTAWAMMNFGYSSKESRSFANLFMLSDLREKYPEIEDEVWDLICSGRVKAGMTKIECKLSLGNPTEVDQGHDYTQTLDLWHYSDGAVLWFEDGLLTRFRQ